MAKNNNGLSKYKIQELQSDVESLKKDLKIIMENELPHLKEQLTGLSTQVKLVGAINILAILTVVALTQLLK